MNARGDGSRANSTLVDTELLRADGESEELKSTPISTSMPSGRGPQQPFPGHTLTSYLLGALKEDLRSESGVDATGDNEVSMGAHRDGVRFSEMSSQSSMDTTFHGNATVSNRPNKKKKSCGGVKHKRKHSDSAKNAPNKIHRATIDDRASTRSPFIRPPTLNIGDLARNGRGKPDTMGPSPVPKTAPDGEARELDGNSSYGSLNNSNLLTASNHEEEHGGRGDGTVPLSLIHI